MLDAIPGGMWQRVQNLERLCNLAINLTTILEDPDWGATGQCTLADELTLVRSSPGYGHLHCD